MHTGVFRAVTLLGGSIATQPKKLLQRAQDKEPRKTAVDHPAHWLIYNRPNRYQNTFQFHFMLVVHLQLWGNFYAFINRNRYYEPTSLIPIAPWKVRPIIDQGRKVYEIDGKKYTDNDLIHIYGLSLDGIQGISPIRYNAESIGIGLAAQKMQSSGFGKGLHAGGIIHLSEEDAGLMGSTDEEAEQYMERIRESFMKQYQDGPTSWHNMMFLEPGWKFEQFKLHFEIDKLVANQKFNMADIARVFGVPLHKLMEMDKATFNNIEHQGIEYVQDGLLPITVNLEQEYNTKLLKEKEKREFYFKVNLDGLQRADIKSRYEAYATALGKNSPGWMEAEEIRDLEDLGKGTPANWAVPSNMDFKKDRDAA